MRQALHLLDLGCLRPDLRQTANFLGTPRRLAQLWQSLAQLRKATTLVTRTTPATVTPSSRFVRTKYLIARIFTARGTV
jgi:penicillin V acylase-like amidase (Ntn superfamily)